MYQATIQLESLHFRVSDNFLILHCLLLEAKKNLLAKLLQFLEAVFLYDSFPKINLTKIQNVTR